MTSLSPQPESAADVLFQVAPRLSRLMERELSLTGNGLSLRQLRVLQRVHDGDVIAAEIARQSSVGPAAMQGVLDGLVDRGFLQRERSKEDRRKQLLQVTPEGDAALANGNEILSRVINALTHGLTAADQKQIATAMDMLDQAIDRHLAAVRVQRNGEGSTERNGRQ